MVVVYSLGHAYVLHPLCMTLNTHKKINMNYMSNAKWHQNVKNEAERLKAMSVQNFETR